MDTFAEIMERHVERHPQRVACVLLPDGEREERTVTYGELDAHARALASALHARGAVGRPVLVLCPPGPEYVAALIGCLYAGAIAVPAHAPTRVSLGRTLPRLLAICGDCDPAAAIVTRSLDAMLRDHPALAPRLSRLACLIADDLAPAALAGPGSRAPGPQPDSPAILQYTSGSTATPKGVLLTHRQLIANHETIAAASGAAASDVVLSWLPPYHDMGLHGGILQPLYRGIPGVLMPPEAFIRKPRRWLAAATRYRASLLCAPNFAFELCVRRIPAPQRAGLDLSSVRLVCSGAEPLHAATLLAFARAFEPYGFRESALYPCYGMAEATLIISGGEAGAGAVIRDYDADELERGRAVPLAAGRARSSRLRRLVGCGHALLDEQIVIADPATGHALDAGRVGEIWVKSRSLAAGYWHRPAETAASFRAQLSDTGEGPFLRTGDLGFFDRGELFVTGRLKDLIIIRGVNHHPQDIERTAQNVHPALVPSGGAAFAVDSDQGEQLVLVQEIDTRAGGDPEALLSAVVQAVRAEHELAARAILFIRRGTLPRTSSGKVQRHAAKAAFTAGALQVVSSFQAQPRPVRPPAAQRFDAPADPARTYTRPIDTRERRIVDWLRDRLARKLGVDPDGIDPREPLARYGVDSLMAAELTEELEHLLGRQLPATISYDNPTIAELARALCLPEASAPRAPEPVKPRARRTSSERDEPIAIVGMACRLPGAPDLESYWSLLQSGVDAITEIPRARWDVDAIFDPEPGRPGKTYSRFGGFVEDIDRFDAAFFGISPREAAHMDPQQRLFLEVAWHALEDAGQSTAALSGTDAGVFAGASTHDHALLYGGDLRMIDVDYGTGAAGSLIANRLSYLLDLRGPSETVDTACSSALVALQRACLGLNAGECDIAIAGAVNAVLAPEPSVYFSQLRALAPDGRCKSFDRGADGFVRSEGAGAVVLKRLSRALEDGDRIYALIAGGAINHDGRSNGVLAPHGAAQREVLRRALARAGVSPDAIDYVEAHGVGTKVADSVEMRALAEVLGARAPDRPLRVGSVKTNLGHLEAASGIASVIKVALALHNERIPKHLHLRDPSPELGIAGLPIEIPTVECAWPRGDRPRFAGVSAFGFGGTNAHLVLCEAPAEPKPARAPEVSEHMLALSARTGTALRALAQRVAAQLDVPSPPSLADVCFTANTGRAHFEHRLAVRCRSAAELARALAAFAQRAPAALAGGSGPEAVLAGYAKPGTRLQIGFAFLEAKVPAFAARALYERHRSFRQALERCDEVLRAKLEVPLLELLYGGDASALAALHARPSHAHAALVALQYALSELFRGLGIEPALVYGAGAGELAAAAACGVLPWEQALELAAQRGSLLESLVASAERRVTLRSFEQQLASIEYQVPSLPFVSASLGRAFLPGEVPGARHFARQLYHVPGAGDAAAALSAERCDVHLEIGPGLADGQKPNVPNWLPSLARSDSERDCLAETLAALYVRGAEIDWREINAEHPRRRITLPGYPFERERHWLDFPERRVEPASSVVIETTPSHPLITRVRVRTPARSGFTRRFEDDGGAGTGSDGA